MFGLTEAATKRRAVALAWGRKLWTIVPIGVFPVPDSMDSSSVLRCSMLLSR